MSSEFLNSINIAELSDGIISTFVTVSERKFEMGQLSIALKRLVALFDARCNNAMLNSLFAKCRGDPIPTLSLLLH